MNKSYSFEYSLSLFGALVIALIIAVVVIFNKNRASENIESTAGLWTTYDIEVSQIKNNLDSIMDYSNEDVTCGNLKGITIKDNSYEAALNRLGCYITLYYYNLTEYNENYHNYIIKYRDKDTIKEKELTSLKQDLKDDNTFYTNLKNMSNYKVDDENLAKKLNDVVSSFLDKFDASFYEECENYTEIISNKISELSYVTYMSSFLKDEYLNLEK